MKKEQIQEFTRRISQSNRTSLVVVIYEIFLAYMEEAIEAAEKGDQAGFRQAVGNAQPVVSELMSVLDHQFQVSQELYRLYKYVGSCLGRALAMNDPKELEGGKLVIEGLREAFSEISRTDDSPPLMRNAQQVYAGLTYGKYDINEVQEDAGGRRGFYV